jgi:hypothetical protein
MNVSDHERLRLETLRAIEKENGPPSKMAGELVRKEAKTGRGAAYREELAKRTEWKIWRRANGTQDGLQRTS